MRKKYILLLMLAVLFLVSCRGISEKDSESSSNKDVLLENETITGTQENTASEVDTEKYVIEYRGVVFKNYFYGYEHDAVYPTTNEIDTGYKDGTTANLYAFVMASHVSVDIEPQGEAETDLEYDVRREKAESEYVVNRALEMGLMVLPEYYYCSFLNEKLG